MSARRPRSVGRPRGRGIVGVRDGPMMRSLPLVVTASLFAASTSTAHGAEPSQEACIDAYTAAQELRLEKRLMAARDQLLICAASSCPQVARVDCSQWLEDTQAALPTVVPQLRGPTGDLMPSAKLYLDGELRLERLDGSAFVVDPGPHRFRFELPDGTSFEKEVVVVEGSKRQAVVVRLEPGPEPTPAPVAPPSPPEEASIHPATWVLGAVAVAGFGVFAGLGGYSLTRESCSPTCTDDERDEIVALRAGADVGLGVGVAGLAAALIVGIVSGTASPDEAAAGVGPWVGPEGAGASAWLRF